MRNDTKAALTGTSLSRRRALGSIFALGAAAATTAVDGPSRHVAPSGFALKPEDQPSPIAEPWLTDALVSMICSAAQPAEGTSARLAELLAKEATASGEYDRIRCALAARLDPEAIALVNELENRVADQHGYEVLISEHLLLAHMAGLAPMVRMLWDHAREDAYYSVHQGRYCCAAVEGLLPDVTDEG